MNQIESGRRQVEKIVKQIASLPSGHFWIHDIKVEKRYRFPVSLDVGDGRQLYIRPEISQMLGPLATTIASDSFHEFKPRFTDSEWNSMVKSAFGRSVVDQEYNLRPASEYEEILNDTKERLRSEIACIQERHYVFGCHFCNVQDLEPLEIGSVVFEPRHKWLERMESEGQFTPDLCALVETAWRAEQLEVCGDSEDQRRKKIICNAIGQCDFVCSVKIGSLGSDAGLQAALTAARLATTAIAIAWDKPSSVLNVMGLSFDRLPHLQQNLVMIPNAEFGWQRSWSFLRGGVTWIGRDNWAGLIADLDPIFNSAAEVISYVTNCQTRAERSDVLDALYQAMLWFHEGCREQLDAMAIVKFCSAMEALSNRKRAKGIKELIKARLKLEKEAVVVRRITKIYDNGRSRFVHGTSDRLRHDWSESRAFTEQLARQCLLRCLELTSSHPEMTDPADYCKMKS